MRKLSQGSLSVFKFESFKKYKNIAHFVTTREGWQSGVVPRFTGDEPAFYTPFRNELARSCQWDAHRFVFPRQSHSDRVQVVSGTWTGQPLTDTDALITNEPGLFICVQTADCVPLLLFDPCKNVVAAIHAGWRGTVARIARQTVMKMTETFHCHPADILAGIGPSIHLHAYEVGPEVIQAVNDSFPSPHTLLQPSLTPGKAFFDLWEANRLTLLEAGLADHHIELMGLCTFQHPGLFFSVRREGPATGRMVSGIRLL